MLDDPTQLRILGDGSQRKSYVHVRDVIDAVLLVHRETRDTYAAYNVSTGDEITVSEIADLALGAVGLEPDSVRYDYTGGDRGWKGDVPVVRLRVDRIRSIGWRSSRSSREAMRDALQALVEETRTERS